MPDGENVPFRAGRTSGCSDGPSRSPEASRRRHPVGDRRAGLVGGPVGHVKLEDGEPRCLADPAEPLLLTDEDVQVVVLVRLAGDEEPLGARSGERLRAAGAQDNVEAERRKAEAAIA